MQKHSQELLEKELELISVCQEIGGISDCNQQYTLQLTLKIDRPVQDLKVSQLLAFHRECTESFNQMEG